MKRKSTVLFILIFLLVGCCISGFSETVYSTVHCDEQNFSLTLPESKTAYWEEGVGFRVSVGEPGYVPYIAVFRRAEKFNNPVNYLNNIYREFMENAYDDEVGTNPCAEYEIGEKKLYAASYHYHANGHALVLTLMIEIREDGDVEYHAKYVEGQSDETFALLEDVVLSYQPDADTDTKQNGKTILPVDISGIEINTQNGNYWAAIHDTEKIMDGGFFTASLYLRDRYTAEVIENLQSGDSVQVNGQNFTVASVLVHEDGTIELIPEETFDGYIVFEKDEDTYTALVNDWSPVSRITDYKVMLPLPNDFSYAVLSGGDDAIVYDADSFIALLTRSDEADSNLIPYNTVLHFEDGLVMVILHSDYPTGPEQP